MLQIREKLCTAKASHIFSIKNIRNYCNNFVSFDNWTQSYLSERMKNYQIVLFIFILFNMTFMGATNKIMYDM